MDLRRLKQVYEQLEGLDERLSHRLRPRSGSMMRPNAEQLDERMRDLADFTLELKDVVRGVIVALASKPKPPPKTG